MAAPSAEIRQQGRIAIRNIGLLLSGDIARPVLDADTILIEDGLIKAVGTADTVDLGGVHTVTDACGMVVAPGLIDNHVHTTAGDWTPRQNQLGWIEASMHGGVTTMISAGEAHYPGRPRDRVGIKALAIAAQRSYANFRPGGVKVIAGAPVLEPGFTEEDFRELAAAGVSIIGEIGLGGINDGPRGRQMIAWARAQGMTSMTHTGGPSIPGSSRIGADTVIAVDADIAAHINGGPTALPFAELDRIVDESDQALEIVHNGNLRAGLHVLERAARRGALDRILLGTDGPAGSGAQPLGILRMITMLASLSDIPVETIVCFATGNVARVRKLSDRGLIEPGRAADLIVMDRAAGGAGTTFRDSVALGNIPGISMVLIDGVTRTTRSRNTPPAERTPSTAMLAQTV
ncbi:amidohydrolase family protein [Methylobacterium symbioticum]|uniref:Enamidase n=1 Tax=Methylobacterium symbioticum TaxID=2584084 RepID=A0A509E7A2_9HYPH|nr:amidohydrolase family protein [Methylobacterium symbioticum]VUD69992.1 Enamidase [Methylobacterium symbioticum]